jgi:hypothetical protein
LIYYQWVFTIDNKRVTKKLASTAQQEKTFTISLSLKRVTKVTTKLSSNTHQEQSLISLLSFLNPGLNDIHKKFTRKSLILITTTQGVYMYNVFSITRWAPKSPQHSRKSFIIHNDFIINSNHMFKGSNYYLSVAHHIYIVTLFSHKASNSTFVLNMTHSLLFKDIYVVNWTVVFKHKLYFVSPKLWVIYNTKTLQPLAVEGVGPTPNFVIKYYAFSFCIYL